MCPSSLLGFSSVAILLTLDSILFATEHTRFVFLSVGISDCAGFMPVVSEPAQGPARSRSSATVSGNRRSQERGREANERAAGCLVHPSPTATSPPFLLSRLTANTQLHDARIFFRDSFITVIISSCHKAAFKCGRKLGDHLPAQPSSQMSLGLTVLDSFALD